MDKGGSRTSAIYGVTVDSVRRLAAIVDSLAHLPRRPTTRVVFDDVPVEQYLEAVSAIHQVSDVMGEIVDSYDMAQYSVERYLQKTRDYLDALGDHVDIWEIGNEVNGEWLGAAAEVSAKVAGAFEIVKARGRPAALTLYYNEACFKNPENEMFAWTARHVPQDLALGVDYLFVSYYEDDCNDLQPDWPTVFHRLAAIFPQATLGFGEC